MRQHHMQRASDKKNSGGLHSFSLTVDGDCYGNKEGRYWFVVDEEALTATMIRMRCTFATVIQWWRILDFLSWAIKTNTSVSYD
jgi:hypothetical protein